MGAASQERGTQASGEQLAPQAVAQSPAHSPAVASAVPDSASPSSNHAGYVPKSFLILLEMESKYFGVDMSLT